MRYCPSAEPSARHELLPSIGAAGGSVEAVCVVLAVAVGGVGGVVGVAGAVGVLGAVAYQEPGMQ